MNKTFTYGFLAIAIVVIVLAGVSTMLNHPGASTATQAVSTDNSGTVATVAEGSQDTASVVNSVQVGQTLTWTAANFPSANVSVVIIKKTSDSPATYAAIRTLSASTPNNGSIAWTPTSAELGNNIYIQIGCVAATTACRSTITPSPFTVKQ